MVRTDYRTAVLDLSATPEQAVLVAAHALAWRLAAILLPVAVVLGVVLLLTGAFPLAPTALICVAVIVGPLVLAVFGTFPVAFVAGVQALFSSSREAGLRFGATGLVYAYYGWRYAFWRRLRPWGALTLDEKRLADPSRADTYWPTAPGD
jgi:hypothetical protein